MKVKLQACPPAILLAWQRVKGKAVDEPLQVSLLLATQGEGVAMQSGIILGGRLG